MSAFQRAQEGRGVRRGIHRAAASAVACLLVGSASVLIGGGASAAACGGFENPCSNETAQQFTYGSVQRQDTPNDPDYDQAEPDTQQPEGNRSSNFYDEKFGLFGFPSQLTTSAIYAVGPHAGKPQVAGFNASGAWKAERGRPDAVVAILDTGIDWGNRGLRDQVHLNTSELPYPEDSGGATHGTYDLNGDGVVNVEDYAPDPRVSLSYSGRTGPGGLITGQDLIHAFGNCQLDNSTHLVVGCPTGQHFDNDSNVIEGANGSIYHSAFAEAASKYAYDHGVVQTFSGDDLNTANHNYPANYPHAMLIQGTVTDSEGLGKGSAQWVQGQKLCGFTGQPACPGSNAPVGTFFRGANTTQYGGKSSISMQGPTGSVNTSKASGAAALVVSAGLDHGISLRSDETRELLEQTAERVLTGNGSGTGTPDPGADPTLPADEQWSSHFGWGRADVGGAVGAVVAGNIPPQAAVDSPDWFAPPTGPSTQITRLPPPRLATGGQVHWKLMWGARQQ